MERYSYRIVSGECAFPQNFHTRKLGEITAFYAVRVMNTVTLYSENITELRAGSGQELIYLLQSKCPSNAIS